MRSLQLSLRLFIFSVLMLLFRIEAQAQTQLLLLRNEHVMLRLNLGDDFVYKLKDSKEIKRSYVSNISETAVYTHRDTVPFHTIDRIYFKHSTFVNRSGSRIFIGGILLFVIDQANELLQGHKLNTDSGVSIVSLSLMGAGLPMMLIRKKSQRIGYRHKLMMVEKGSLLYKGD